MVNALKVKPQLIEKTAKYYKNEQQKGNKEYTIVDAFVEAQGELDTDDMHPDEYKVLEQEVVQAVEMQL